MNPAGIVILSAGLLLIIGICFALTRFLGV